MGYFTSCVLLLLFSTLSFIIPTTPYERRYNDLRIDCGASNETAISYNGLLSWHTDEQFVETGKNYLLKYSETFSTMNSLRFFPVGQRNCYRLPLFARNQKFLFRAGFYYGNYDGLSEPPNFRLEIDGHLWAMVTTATSAVESVYHEMIYKTKADSATVCLVNTGNGVPFISSLEATFRIADFYRLMENETALLLHSRIDYGSNKSIEKLIGTLEECCNRIWKSKEMPEYPSIAAEVIPEGSANGENCWSLVT